jgi:GNAT superfamily N-acetyltransferase
MRILDVVDEAGFGRIPPCADARFDHRTCDYWEDEVRGSKAHRASWLEGGGGAGAAGPARGAEQTGRLAVNPFAPTAGPGFNPFAPAGASGGPRRSADPFGDSHGGGDQGGDDVDAPIDNPFAPRPAAKRAVGADAPRKLQLLARGRDVFGSYAKVLEVDGEAEAYCQFGPLSAYPRARRVRELYAQLPVSPLPAVITCIATTLAVRREGLARRLVEAVTTDLAGRGFAAVEAYPEPDAEPDATSAANPAFWLACGFDLAVDDPRFPVVRREL